MSFQLLSILSVAAVAATSLGATSETRSAQSLPARQLASAHAPASHTGKLHSGKHLADSSSEQLGVGKCKHGHWVQEKMACANWWKDSGARLAIGAGTVSGLVYAVSQGGETSGGGGSVSN